MSRICSPRLPVEGDMFRAHVLLADADFDGHNDLLFTEGALYPGQNFKYRLLFWDKKTKSFVPSESFYEILNPVVDARDKVIRSSSSKSDTEDVYSIYRHRGREFYKDMEVIVPRNRDEIKLKDPKLWGQDSIWKLDDPIWKESWHYRISENNT